MRDHEQAFHAMAEKWRAAQNEAEALTMELNSKRERIVRLESDLEWYRDMHNKSEDQESGQ